MAKYQPIERPWVECAYMACNNRAILRRKNQNLCQQHYDQQNADAAFKWCEEHGLHTVEDKKKFIFEHEFKIKRMP